MSAATDKDSATLQAVAAMSGIVVDRTTDQAGRVTWYVSKWGYCKRCASLSEVQQLLRQMGVCL